MPLHSRVSRLLAAALAAVVLPASMARAEEGMWTFDRAPLAEINAEYGLSLDQAWLDRLRTASVRIAGCSGSVVSPEGLVLTNAHCVLSCMQDLSAGGEDLRENGLVLASRDEERTCPGQIAEILLEIVDVTDRIKATGEGLQGAAFVQARDAVEEALVQETCQGDPKMNCQLVSFYRGGRYAMYKYRTYRDVRLAFAPEHKAALFGGDLDNFHFPRYSLDFAFLRLYEDGQPAVTPQHLRWTTAAPREGEAAFTSGHPATTQRQLPVVQLERLRDQQLPLLVATYSELRGRLIQFSQESEENARVAAALLNSVENSYKVFNGQLTALRDPRVIQMKRDEEAALQAAVAADPELAPLGEAWAEMERSQTAARALFLPYRQLEANAGVGSSLYMYARLIVRAVAEHAKSEAERRPGFGDAEFASIGRRMAIDRPIEPDLERLHLTFWLEKTRELLTADDPNARALLGSETPIGLATRLVEGTTLADPAARTAFLAMTPEQLAASDDPMIQFVLANDTAAQLARTQFELGAVIPGGRAAEKITRARFAIHGDSQPPDANSTLRLSYGKVAGWNEGRRRIDPITRIAGLYERATGADPFELAPRWEEARDEVDPRTAFAFVTTNDISGGNSGSPVVNGRGEVIGTAFDGNIHAIAGAFAYDESLQRTVVLSTAVMTEALRTVYDQTHLLKELGQR